MIQVKRGDIWLVNLDPTVGHEIRKSRPGLVIQNDIGNKYSPVTIIAPITSQKAENIYPFEAGNSKKVSGLDKNSKILLNQIRAIDKNRLVKKFGKADEETMTEVNEAIKVSLGLAEI